MKLLSTMFIFILLLTGCTNDDDNGEENLDILQKLRNLEGVEVTEIEIPEPIYERSFQLDFLLPVDHANPAKETFRLRAYLNHKREEYPMVMRTGGYSVNPEHLVEPCKMFDNNYISINHRYFKNSIPESRDWKYLTVKQAADDLHLIRDKLKSIYSGRILSTGASKDGMTALFYKYFYPEDVDATIAYVAPIMTGLPDKRFDEYLLNRAGTSELIGKIKEFQITVLNRREEIIEEIKKYPPFENYNFSKLGYDATLELAVLEYWFYYFEFHFRSSNTPIPPSDASAYDIFYHLNRVSPIFYYTDTDYIDYMPFYYQVFTELGYYYFIDDHIKDKLQVIKDSSHRILTPQDIELKYSSDLMEKISLWLKTKGNRIVYVYGEKDPYTYTPGEPGTTDSLKFVIPGFDHFARIRHMDGENREKAIKKLEQWLGVKIDRDISNWKNRRVESSGRKRF